jgi:hypothetical protein
VVGDAALLVLATPTTAPPIALATGADAALEQPGGAAQVAGWGLTNPLDQTSLPDVLQAAPTVVQNSTYCRVNNVSFDAQAQLCAVDTPTRTTSICDGDSGGPLVAQASASTWIQIGISSAAINNCDTQTPDMFARVDYVDPWIQSWIAALPSPPAAASAPPASATTTTPPATAGAPTAAEAGRYTGTSSQRHGHVYVTIGANGITRVNVKFNLHCTRGRRLRGPLTQTWSRTTAPIALVAADGAWTFATRFTDASGNRYSVSGTLSTPGAASGTLSVVMGNRGCRTGLVRWGAWLPS